MPQYQLHHKDVGDPGDPNSPQLRFVLAMPEQPLLIEASIFIDGQPFRQAREKRVQEIMRYIADPEAFRAEADRILAEAQTAAAAKNAPGLVESIANLVTGNAPANVPADPEPEVIPDPPESPPTDEVQPEESTPEATETPATAEAPAEPAVPAVPKYAAPATTYERIDRYTQSTGTPPSVEEVRWLLTNWVDGPLLLFLNDNFQRFRAGQQPVYKVLDRDRDNKVSAEELSQAVTSFRECDLNRDDIVEATELAQAADDPRDQPTSSSTGKLIFRLPDDASATAFLRRLAARYAAADAPSPTVPRFDVDGNGALSPEEVKQLHERLTAFDRNADGQITLDETHPTFRVCIGLGPTAHQPLALLREVNAPASTTQVPGPEWFAEMDKTKDYDLTRQEFPGTDEQFKQLDTDADELVSAEEANKS